MLNGELISMFDETNLRKDMEKWINRFYPEDKISYPTEWMDPAQRSIFSEVAELVLGEDISDWWQQNKVFRHFGSLNFESIDLPIDNTEIPIVVRKEDDLEPLAVLFMCKFEVFLVKLVSILNNNKEFSSDPDRISEGLLWGIGYALNSPTRETNIDQRLNFFNRYPNSLSPGSIFKVCEKTMDSTSAAILTCDIFNRVDRALFSSGFCLGNSRDGLESFFSRKKSCSRKEKRKETKKIVTALAKIANDSSESVKDGLLSYFGRIIELGESVDLKKFVKYNIEQRIRSSRTREGKRKEHELNYSRNADDISDGYSGGDIQIQELQTEEYVSEDGVHVSSSATRHVDNRIATPFERQDVAEYAKTQARKTIESVSEIMDFVVNNLKKENESSLNIKDVINNKRRSTQSDRLSVFLPDFLDLYIKAAFNQIDVSIRSENEICDKNGCLIYKKGKSSISWNSDKRIKNISSFVDSVAFAREMQIYIDLKMNIYNQYLKCKDIKKIAQLLEIPIKLVESSIIQFKILSKPKSVKSKNKIDPVKNYFCNKINAVNVMNSFTWQWGKILAILYKPVKDLDMDYLRLCSDERNNSGKPRLVTRQKDRFGRFCKSKLRKQFSRKISSERAYSKFSCDALFNFKNLLTVHSCIKNGTLPNSFFGIGKDATVGSTAGAVWGHHLSKLTKESNIQMFYEMFHGGFDRNNTEHKEIRANVSKFILLRRAKEESVITGDDSWLRTLIIRWKGIY